MWHTYSFHASSVSKTSKACTSERQHSQTMRKWREGWDRQHSQKGADCAMHLIPSVSWLEGLEVGLFCGWLQRLLCGCVCLPVHCGDTSPTTSALTTLVTSANGALFHDPHKTQANVAEDEAEDEALTMRQQLLPQLSHFR